MAKISGQDGQTVAASGGRDGNIGKAGRVPGGARLVRQLSRQACRGYIEGQHPLAIEMEHDFKPITESGGPGSGSVLFILAMPPETSATVTADRKSASECVSIQSISSGERSRRPGAPTDSTLVSTRYRRRS